MANGYRKTLESFFLKPIALIDMILIVYYLLISNARTPALATTRFCSRGLAHILGAQYHSTRFPQAVPVA